MAETGISKPDTSDDCARAASSLAAMIDEWKNIGLNAKGKADLARLIEKRLRRFWPK